MAKTFDFNTFCANVPQLSDLEGRVARLFTPDRKDGIPGMVRKAPEGAKTDYVFAFIANATFEGRVIAHLLVYIPINPHMIDGIAPDFGFLAIDSPYSIKPYYVKDGAVEVLDDLMRIRNPENQQ